MENEMRHTIRANISLLLARDLATIVRSLYLRGVCCTERGGGWSFKATMRSARTALAVMDESAEELVKHPRTG